MTLLSSCASAATPPQAAEWAADAQEAKVLLQELVRIDTINPPQPGSGKANADETALCAYVQKLLAKDGIPSEIIESAPGRGNLVARLKGSGAKKPFLMMAHVDVVNVDPAKWRVPPLSGAEQDGYVWGRGTLDDKGMAAVCIQAFRMAHRRKLPLARDVILMLNADEESSGHMGAEFMVKRHWDKIACEFLINEGGRMILKDGRVDIVGIQAAEKVYNDVKIWVAGESGHSSIPRPKNAIYSAARLLSKLEAYKPPVRIQPIVASYLGGLAPRQSDPAVAALMKGVSEGSVAAAEELASRDPRFNAILRSTFVPTVIEGGIRDNVLPPDVVFNLNIRLLPGEKLNDLIAALVRACGLPAHATIEVAPDQDWRAVLREWIAAQERKRLSGTAGETFEAAILVDDRGLESPISPLDTELFAAMARIGRDMAPGAWVGPVMLTGATDSRYFRIRGVPAYGLLPLPATDEDFKGFHDHNERVPVASIEYGIRYTYRLLEELQR